MCTGVRQGSVEGPVLFILFLAAVMEVAFPANSRYRSEMGVELEVQEGDITDARRFRNPVSHRVLDTIYADDTALVADSHASMQETVQRFAVVAECFGLLINQSKTVVMCAVPNASVTPQHIYIRGNALQDVSSFSYLGSAITPNNDMQEIDLRVAKARTAYHMLSQRLWGQHGIRRKTKVKVCNVVVTSTLLYGAGMWTRKESQTKRLESVQYCLARRMLGVKLTDHVCMTKAYESFEKGEGGGGFSRYQFSTISNLGI